MTASYLHQSPHYGRSTVWTTIHAVLRPFLTVWAQKKGSDRKMKRTRISVLLVIALLLQLCAPLTAGAADFTPNPQTEYAKRFIGRLWGTGMVYQRDWASAERTATHTGYHHRSRRPCGNQEHWSKRSEHHRTYTGLQLGNLVNCGICSSRIIIWAEIFRLCSIRSRNCRMWI